MVLQKAAQITHDVDDKLFYDEIIPIALYGLSRAKDVKPKCERSASVLCATNTRSTIPGKRRITDDFLVNNRILGNALISYRGNDPAYGTKDLVHIANSKELKTDRNGHGIGAKTAVPNQNSGATRWEFALDKSAPIIIVDENSSGRSTNQRRKRKSIGGSSSLGARTK